MININNDKGWTCPKCGRVNAPWVVSCDCCSRWYVPFAPTYPTFPYPYYPTITWCSGSSSSDIYYKETK